MYVHCCILAFMQGQQQAGGSLGNDLLLQILDHQVKNAEVLGKIQGDVAALAGPTGRVTVMEEAQKHDRRMRWVHSAIIVPVLGILHAVANRYGVQL